MPKTLWYLQWCRITPRRLLIPAATFLLCIGLFVHVDQQFHPDKFLLPSSQLAALLFPDVSWLHFVAGNFFQPRSKEVSPLPRLLFGPSHFCQEFSFLVVIVPSPPQDFHRRQVIRNTWGQAVRSGAWPRSALQAVVEVFFVLGSTEKLSDRALVAREAAEHDDLIVGDFLDSYRNLTRKVLTGLNWVSQHCASTRFVMKVDQDTLVDFPRMTNFLLEHKSELRNCIIGKLYYSSKPLTKGKWKVSQKEYPFSFYPTFAGGPCYLISTDAVARIVNVSRYLPFFVMEDVLVTGVAAQAAGVQRRYMQQLQNWNWGDSLCVFLQRDKLQVSLTELSSHKLQHVWNILTSGSCLPYSSESPAKS